MPGPVQVRLAYDAGECHDAEALPWLIKILVQDDGDLLSYESPSLRTVPSLARRSTRHVPSIHGGDWPTRSRAELDGPKGCSCVARPARSAASSLAGITQVHRSYRSDQYLEKRTIRPISSGQTCLLPTACDGITSQIANSPFPLRLLRRGFDTTKLDRLAQDYRVHAFFKGGRLLSQPAEVVQVELRSIGREHHENARD